MLPIYLFGGQPKTFQLEYLVVAGGGSGGTGSSGTGGGGGGAGGYRSSVVGELSGRNSTAESLFNVTQATTYTVTVGAGGPRIGFGGTTAKGNNSVFGSITSLGGGGGTPMTVPGGIPAPGYDLALLNGGSGGGAGYEEGGSGGIVYGPGTGATGQGFGGGGAVSDGVGGGIGGGGGGASQTGATANLSSAGKGGDGLASSITGNSVTRAGGGGGAKNANLGPTPAAGAGGAGGGGAGGSGFTGNGEDGQVNTGGGGGSMAAPAFTTSWSGAGGSGIVILRYPVSRLITIGPGLTGTTSIVGSNKVTVITAGTGNVSFV